MNDARGERSSHRQASVEEILALRARVTDIFEIDPETWAIHGFIPVDGEVILAEFDNAQTARSVLDELARVGDEIAATQIVPGHRNLPGRAGDVRSVS